MYLEYNNGIKFMPLNGFGYFASKAEKTNYILLFINIINGCINAKCKM